MYGYLLKRINQKQKYLFHPILQQGRLFYFLKTCLILWFTFISHSSAAQPSAINPSIVNKQWTAQWITVPDEPTKTNGVYHFRKEFTISKTYSSFIIHVSGDNRYKLYLNGRMISLGPARGDITHWNYETVDIAAALQPGKNTLAAVVWNYGPYMPEAQISYRTGFIVQGNTEAERIVDTDKSWKCFKNNGHRFAKPVLGYATYYVSCPAEQVDGQNYPWGWELPDYNADAWPQAAPIFNGLPKGVASWDAGWELIPRNIPQVYGNPARFATIRKTEGITLSSAELSNPRAFTIPVNTKAKILFDQSYITNAYPVLNFNKGKQSRISIGYAESLYLKDGYSPDKNNAKGNRNEVEGKLFLGYKDELTADGGKHSFSPLAFRTFRYVELTVETKDEPLVIEDFYNITTGYPFVLLSEFNAPGNQEFGKILETGWRTLKLCAVETYIDCPYYEQLQYVGDTRIEALVTLYNTSDDRLVRNAIEKFSYSRTSEGITWCRWPANDPQFIPPFSLLWVNMLHDYWMYRGDSAFVKSMLPGTRAIMDFFEARRTREGLLEKVPYWNFIDWVSGWQYGIPPTDEYGRSALFDLHYLMAITAARDLERSVGKKEYAGQYDEIIRQLHESIRKTYWDSDKKYFSDTPEKKYFSQHANALAVLNGIIKDQEARDLMSRTVKDTLLSPCSIYYRFYLNQAVTKAGLGDMYIDLLGEWKAQLKRGMTTWAESPEPTRSDCHAWGSSPNIEAYRTILGISSTAPGFAKIKIEPFPGTLKEVSGSIPHPAGKISVSYKINKKGVLEATIDLPPGVTGNFIWKGKENRLISGRQVIIQ